MQSSSRSLQQFKQALSDLYQQWRDKQWEMLNVKLELPLFDTQVCLSLLQMDEETVLEICDDDWDQLVGNSLAMEDSIIWQCRPQDGSCESFQRGEAEVAMFQQGTCRSLSMIFIGLLEVHFLPLD
ncbi:MAG: hypothetical protein ACLSA6_15155 [Holdemania massiliensis]